MTAPTHPALSAERIGELRADVTKRAGPFYAMDPEELLSLLSAATRLTEMGAAMRWIPVGERLPTVKDGTVLVVSGRHPVVHWAWFRVATKEWRYDDETVPGVTHWMPLPAAPRTEAT